MRSTRVQRLRLRALAAAAAVVAACGPEPAGPGSAAAGAGVRPSVLLVSIDTLRADHVGAWGAADARTPTLDALASDGARFERAFSPTPLTLPSHTTLLTGQDPPRHGVRHNGVYRLRDASVTLAERLREGGWRTGAVVASTVLAARYGLDQGFDHYDDAIDPPGSRVAGGIEQRRAEAVTDAGLAWLARTPDPFFLWLHYYDPHASYEPPPPFDRLFAGRPYDGEIAAVDASLARVVDALRAQGRLERTLVVVTADHGESLGEHDEPTHAYSLYDATQHVPLLLRGPGVPAGRVVEGVVRLADVAPTVLSLLERPFLPEADGLDLRPLLAEGAPPSTRMAYLETLATRIDHGWSPLHALRSRGFLYVRAPRPELYDVGADPRQLDNRLPAEAEADTARARGFEAELNRRLAGAESGEAVALDADTLARLRALGYALPEAPVESTGLDPKDGLRHYRLYHRAQLAEAEGRPEEARALLAELVERDPTSALAQARLGVAELRAGELDGALVHSRRAAELAPANAAHWTQLGAVHAARGEPGPALEVLERAISQDPEDSQAWLLRMESLVALGRAEPAEAAAARVRGLAPHDVAALRRLADAWERAGDTERALGAYRDVLAVAPDSNRDHMHAAIHLARLGRVEDAEAHRARAGPVADDPRARRMLAEAYRAAGRRERAREVAPSDAGATPAGADEDGVARPR